LQSTILPEAVADEIKLKYPDWTIIEADKTETPKHITIYEADLKKGKEKKSIGFKDNGIPISE
jgi:hypothetical protein